MSLRSLASLVLNLFLSLAGSDMTKLEIGHRKSSRHGTAGQGEEDAGENLNNLSFDID